MAVSASPHEDRLLCGRSPDLPVAAFSEDQPDLSADDQFSWEPEAPGNGRPDLPADRQAGVRPTSKRPHSEMRMPVRAGSLANDNSTKGLCATKPDACKLNPGESERGAGQFQRKPGACDQDSGSVRGKVQPVPGGLWAVAEPFWAMAGERWPVAIGVWVCASPGLGVCTSGSRYVRDGVKVRANRPFSPVNTGFS